MRYLLDNNLSPDLAQGMRAFGEDVCHLTDHFREDTPDTEWLEYIGSEDIFLITRDERIRKNPAELRALKQFKVGAFFLGGKNRTRCELIQQLVRNWPRIKEHTRSKARPFAFRIAPRGASFDRISL